MELPHGCSLHGTAAERIPSSQAFAATGQKRLLELARAKDHRSSQASKNRPMEVEKDQETPVYVKTNLATNIANANVDQVSTKTESNSTHSRGTDENCGVARNETVSRGVENAAGRRDDDGNRNDDDGSSDDSASDDDAGSCQEGEYIYDDGEKVYRLQRDKYEQYEVLTDEEEKKAFILNNSYRVMDSSHPYEEDDGT